MVVLLVLTVGEVVGLTAVGMTVVIEVVFDVVVVGYTEIGQIVEGLIVMVEFATIGAT